MLRKYKIYITLLILLMVLSLGVLVWLVLATNPYEQPLLALTGFYALLFMFSFCLLSNLGFVLRRRFGSREMVPQHFKISIRQAILLSIALIASLILQSLSLFSWINMGLLLVALVFLEFFFINYDKNNLETKN